VLGVALCLSAFGVWGCFTQDGLRRFNEADGVYPFYSLLAGGALIILGVCLLLVIASRPRRPSERFGFPVVQPDESRGG
jgi:hypothetical protein